MTATFADFTAGALKRAEMRAFLTGVAEATSSVVEIKVVEDRHLLTSHFRVYAPLHVLKILAGFYPRADS